MNAIQSKCSRTITVRKDRVREALTPGSFSVPKRQKCEFTRLTQTKINQYPAQNIQEPPKMMFTRIVDLSEWPNRWSL